MTGSAPLNVWTCCQREKFLCVLCGVQRFIAFGPKYKWSYSADCNHAIWTMRQWTIGCPVIKRSGNNPKCPKSVTVWRQRWQIRKNNEHCYEWLVSVLGQFMHNWCLLPQLFLFRFLSSFLHGLVENLFEIRNKFDIVRSLLFSKPTKLVGVDCNERVCFRIYYCPSC
jgi:hypothetical protein